MPCRSNSAQAKSSPRTPNSCLNSVDGIAHPRSEACVHRPQIVRGHQTCGKSPPKGCGKDRRKRQADVSTNVSTAAVSMVGMCSCRHQASSWVRRAAASSITQRINKRAKEYKIPRRVLHSDYINATCPEWPRIPATWAGAGAITGQAAPPAGLRSAPASSTPLLDNQPFRHGLLDSFYVQAFVMFPRGAGSASMANTTAANTMISSLQVPLLSLTRPF
jgi:hypothetical protein